MNQLPHGSIVEVAGHLSGLIIDGFESSSVVIKSLF